MHAREFIKPHPVMLRHPHPQKPGEFLLVPYSFDAYVAECIWLYDKWNTVETWGDAQIRIGDAIEAAAVGEPVKFEELDDWEKFREANNAAQIKGAHAHKVRRMQKAIKGAHAPDKPPANE